MAEVPARTQVAIVYDDGHVVGTGNADEQRPALSLAKLYLGYWVLYNGSDADKGRVYEMIRVSHDGIATQLDSRYPAAIGSVISQFGLSHTYYPGYWGSTMTSASDVARFVKEIRNDPVAAPLINGMRDAAPVANDGYPQNYGTSHTPGAQGTKFGWSDNRGINATVTFGPGWVIAANTYGSAGTLTADVAGIDPAQWAPAAPAVPSAPVPVTGAAIPSVPGLTDLANGSSALLGNAVDPAELLNQPIVQRAQDALNRVLTQFPVSAGDLNGFVPAESSVPVNG